MPPLGAILFAYIPERRLSGKSQRDTYLQPRIRRLSADQEEKLRQVAPGWAPRDMAATFGVSHETVRKDATAGLGGG